MPRDPFEELGISPHQENTNQPRDPFEELGVKPEQQNWLQRQQNTWYGGAGTSLANHALDALSAPEQFARGLGNMPTTLANMLPGVNLPYMNQGQQLGGYQIPEPEEPTKGYKVGHALGTGAAYAPMAYSMAGMAAKAAPTLGKLMARGLRINPAEVGAKIESAVSPAAIRNAKAPTVERYQNIEKLMGKEPFYSNKDLANSYVQKNSKFGKAETSPNRYIDLSKKELEMAKAGYGELGVNTVHDELLAGGDYTKAQTLQSDLLKKIRHYEKKASTPNGLDPGENKILIATKKAQELLKNEIKNKIKSKPNGKEHLNNYEEADKLYASKVKPLEHAAMEVEESRYQPGNKLNLQKLYKKLEAASSDKALKHTSIPKEVLEMKETLGQRLNNKDIAKRLGMWGAHGTLGGLGLGMGYGGYALLKHLAHR